MITVGEGLGLAGVIFAAGATIERLRRMESGARAQYRRIGDLQSEVAELRGQVQGLAAWLPPARGVVSGVIPSQLVADDDDTPPPRPLPRPPK